MKLASMLLGIIGGALLLMISLIFMIITVINMSALPLDHVNVIAKIVFSVFFGIGGIGGIFGIVGGALVRRKNVLPAVFMFIGTGAGFITLFVIIPTSPMLIGGIIPVIAMLIGGIFALRPNKKGTQSQIKKKPQQIIEGDTL